nr:Dyp-type peroxidase domain-containing protein [Cryobacterium sp. Hb1]
MREADLEEGQDRTAWHAIEKDLWPAEAETSFEPYSAEKRAAFTQQLITDTDTDTDTLHTKVQGVSFTLSQQSNGAIGLLDEVVTDQVWVSASDGPAWLVGGFYLVARRIRVTIETWDLSIHSEQEAVFGITMGSGSPLFGSTEFTEPNSALAGRADHPLIGAAAHVRLAHPAQNNGAKLLRRS